MKTKAKNYQKQRNAFVVAVSLFSTTAIYIVYVAVSSGIINGSTYVSGF